MKEIIKDFVKLYSNFDDYNNTLLALSFKYNGRTLDAYNTVLLEHNGNSYLIPSPAHYNGFADDLDQLNFIFPIITKSNAYLVVISWIIKYLYDKYDVFYNNNFCKIIQVANGHDLDLTKIYGKRTYCIYDDELSLRYHGETIYVPRDEEDEEYVKFKLKDNVSRMLDIIWLMYSLSIGYNYHDESANKNHLEYLNKVAELSEKHGVCLW